MAIFFLEDVARPVRTDLQCLYCERLFESRRVLDEHYLVVHEEAFSDEELRMARSGTSQFVETP